MKYDMKLGKERRGFRLNEACVEKVLLPNRVEEKIDADQIIKESFQSVKENEYFNQLRHQGGKVGIVASRRKGDMPIHLILNALLEEVLKAGFKAEDIFIVLSLNNERRLKPSERLYIGGDVAQKHQIPVIEYNEKYCVSCGTINGCEIEIFEPLLLVDHIFCINEIQHHPLAGYSGGWMTLFPGVGRIKNGKEMITEKIIKAIENQKVEDHLAYEVQGLLRQLNTLLPVDFFSHGIMGRHQQLIACASGPPKGSYEAAISLLDSYYKIHLNRPVDIVIASAGGDPVDKNLSQLQNAIVNAHGALKEEGAIVLVASAKDGFGEYEFSKWIKEMTQAEREEKLKEDLSFWGFKATFLGKMVEEHAIYLVSDLDSHIVHKIGFLPSIGVEEAIEAEETEKGRKLNILLMPDASYTWPYIEKKKR